jgi:hypothetical protein
MYLIYTISIVNSRFLDERSAEEVRLEAEKIAAEAEAEKLRRKQVEILKSPLSTFWFPQKSKIEVTANRFL